MSNNLVFHRVRIGGLDFEASVLADGPALVVRGHDGRYAGWAVLGVSHLHWFASAEPGFASPRGQGWHLVKYSEEVRAYLPGFGEAELRRLREEFGLLTDTEPGRPDEAFYASRAWAGLVKWVAAHPKLARRYAHHRAHLPGWYERAQQAAQRAAPA
jgi:hypothetical protein